MPSSADPVPSTDSRSRGAWRSGNRKVHLYVGLYFLFFVWLFALTGLLLNHSWSFAEFWPNRKVSTREQPVILATTGTPLEQARDLMRQLDINGEIQWLTTRAAGRFDFRVTKPGVQFEIKTDLNTARATVERTDVNAWGIARTLHTFTGVRMNDTKNDRDWLLTRVWAYSMDAVAAGLAVMVVTGLVLWWGLPAKRIAGLIALGSGVLACAWFLFALRWIYG